ERLPLEQMPLLEKFILHRLWELDAHVRQAYVEYRFQDVVRPVLEFCSNDLSALYFDIRKDSLYCDRPDALRRRAARTVMDAVFMRLTAWLAPLTPFTMEEAWTTRFPDAGTNCARVIPETPAEWENAAEAKRWKDVQWVLLTVNEALEASRREKTIGSTLDAEVAILTDQSVLDLFESEQEAADVFRSSSAKLILWDADDAKALDVWDSLPAISFEPIAKAMSDQARLMVKVLPITDRPKCARSWRRVPDVGSDPAYPDLSARDADAVRYWDQTRS
ncbi:MAG: class I tRNA ligase family protein, partial [Alphaproteobacteria bacterium]|nr:class I tRNA ligase family protein [Alphaproteobacteria bacterium]